MTLSWHISSSFEFGNSRTYSVNLLRFPRRMQLPIISSLVSVSALGKLDNVSLSVWLWQERQKLMQFGIYPCFLRLCANTLLKYYGVAVTTITGSATTELDGEILHTLLLRGYYLGDWTIANLHHSIEPRTNAVRFSVHDLADRAPASAKWCTWDCSRWRISLQVAAVSGSR